MSNPFQKCYQSLCMYVLLTSTKGRKLILLNLSFTTLLTRSTCDSSVDRMAHCKSLVQGLNPLCLLFVFLLVSLHHSSRMWPKPQRYRLLTPSLIHVYKYHHLTLSCYLILNYLIFHFLSYPLILSHSHISLCLVYFSHKCIRQSLEVDNRCPKCNFNIEKKDDIFPNILCK